MHIKALRGTVGDYGQIRRGQVVNVPDRQAQLLVKRGLFVPVQMEAAGTAPSRPSQMPQTGGVTGETKSASSSPRVRRQKTSTLTASEGALAS